jgi:hypothetical protein
MLGGQPLDQESCLGDHPAVEAGASASAGHHRPDYSISPRTVGALNLTDVLRICEMGENF